jgi:hypothetical protein
MSYIEGKYFDKIYETFNNLSTLETNLMELLANKSIKFSDEIAKLCADVNKKINLILKKYYPEIKEMKSKLAIKSSLNFYFDLLDKLTDFIRNVENFQKIDDKYYDTLVKFLKDKEKLINGKYKAICSQELTAFYDPKSRDALEKILETKIERKNREFFTIGPLEEEIKKLGKINGIEQISIRSSEDFKDLIPLESAQSVIDLGSELEKESRSKVAQEITEYLESKRYKVIVLKNLIFTDAKLFPDNP